MRPFVPHFLLLALFFTALSLRAQITATRPATAALKMPAEGSTAPYKITTAFGGLGFDQPVQVVLAPGETTRAFVVERSGRVAVIRDTAAPTREVFLDLSAIVETVNGGLLSLAFHPRFAANGYLYVWFTGPVAGGRATRLVRYRVSAADPHRADPASATPILTQVGGPFGHDGGMVQFGPDGYLYVSIGDGDQNLPAIAAAHQRIDRGFFGGIVRLDVDLRAGNLAPNPHPNAHPGAYLVPADNPFVGATEFNGLPVVPAQVRTEFWAAGLRNPWRFSFDAAGRLWCADVGLSTREEINLVEPGGNYGWPYREGLAPGPRTDPAPAGARFAAPIWDYGTSQGLSITGGFVYRGTKFPELADRYLFADFVSGRIWALADNGARPLPAAQILQLGTETGITALTPDPGTGDILFSDFDSHVIKRLALNPNAAGTPLPATLSATGAFSDVATLTPAPGVHPFAVSAPFWSDHARKRRWFALPAGTFGFAWNSPWSVPAGAVWIKHFDLDLRRGDPASARRLETRLLVKTVDGLYGATYRWNNEQTDAALVPDDGTTQDFAVTDTDGTRRTQRWTYPSRASCLTCHTDGAGGVLSFNARQLGPTQLAALSAAGYFGAALPPTAPGFVPLVDPADNAQPLERRARSYLDANCSQCHQPGGTALGAWDARARVPLSLAGLIDGPLLTATGLAGEKVIVPGDHTRSALHRRLQGAANAPRMPPLATHERDLAGESLVAQWIAALAQVQPPGRLLNLSARAQVGTDSDLLIPGFVIGAGAPKTLLVRAVGPTLGAFGVGDALAAPVLTLFDSAQRPVAANSGWANAPDRAAIRAVAARVGAFPLADASLDSVLLATLAPGAYTAQTAGAANGTGVALVELYDADTAAGPAASRLVNTAVRAQVGTGAAILIPGLIVGEGAAKTVLIRAVGPALAAFGVEGALAEPVVSLYYGTESFLSNQGWPNAANAAAIRATAARVGAFALADGSKDSAILASLSPGAYTIQVRGANATTGVALVEVYEVP